jgi:hypothetical protein
VGTYAIKYYCSGGSYSFQSNDPTTTVSASLTSGTVILTGFRWRQGWKHQVRLPVLWQSRRDRNSQRSHRNGRWRKLCLHGWFSFQVGICHRWRKRHRRQLAVQSNVHRRLFLLTHPPHRRSVRNHWLTFSPPSLNFNNGYVVGDNPSTDITVTNSDGIFVGIGKITKTGSATFTQTNTCGKGLPAYASCTITVTFTPTAAATVTGTLTVTEAAGTAHKIPLSGTAGTGN